jgi:hypothetical protein
MVLMTDGIARKMESRQKAGSKEFQLSNSCKRLHYEREIGDT